MVRTTRNFAYVLLVLLLFSQVASVGCAKSTGASPPHPNQINSFDGTAYDTLTAAQAALDSAKEQYKNHQLPPSAKPIINAAGVAYDIARADWVLWRDTVNGLKVGDPATLQKKLTQDLDAMTAAIFKVKMLQTDPTGGGR